jgi:hypothetical protein
MGGLLVGVELSTHFGFLLVWLSCSVWIDPRSLEPRAKTLG